MTEVEDLVKKFERVKKAKADAEISCASAETEYNVKKESYRKSATEIFTKYGVKSIEELRAKVQSEGEILSKEINEADSALNIVSGSTSDTDDLLTL